MNMNFDLFKTNLLQSVLANDNSLVLKLLTEHSSFALRWKDLITKNGDTVLHLAAHSGCVSVIKYYSEHGNRVILEHRNLDGKTPLHIAAHSSQLQCVKHLLSYGVSVNALKRSDWTPLMLACTKSNLDIIKEFVANGADLNIANKDGWTAFHIASREGNVDVIQYLLKLNPLAWNTKSKNGRTPLHTACLHGHLEVVKIFLESAGYEINVKDSCGITPLMDAVSGNHNEVVEFLVEKRNGLPQRCYTVIYSKVLLHGGCKCNIQETTNRNTIPTGRNNTDPSYRHDSSHASATGSIRH
ncbi:unnamed protein product [Larinioides sclopetarius]|uniref:Ankyrin repeat domain-containing protein 16 n=1 Tax=Larinioides sclopetarius TaxID=280406 RepID=A0AAV2A4A8_9ARAC